MIENDKYVAKGKGDPVFFAGLGKSPGIFSIREAYLEEVALEPGVGAESTLVEIEFWKQQQHLDLCTEI